MGVLEARAILTQGCSNTSNSKLLYDTVYNLQKVSVFRSVARWHDLGRTSQLEGRGDYTENDLELVSPDSQDIHTSEPSFSRALRHLAKFISM